MLVHSCCLALLMLQQPYTLKVDVPAVSVDVNVTDLQGRPVNSLGKDDFIIRVDGRPQGVQYFGPTVAPYNVLLLLNSKYTVRSPKPSSRSWGWDFMLDAVRHLLSNLRPQDRISIASYAYDYRIFLNWGQADEAKAIAAMDLVKDQPDGYGIQFYEAIDNALKRGFKGIAERRALVVIGDTLDESLLFTGAAEQFKSTLQSAQRLGIPIYLVVVEPAGSIWGDRLMVNLELLAQASGGQVLRASSMRELSALYASISARLGTAYSLGFTPSKTDHGQSHKIEVTIPSNNFRVSQSRVGYVTP